MAQDTVQSRVSVNMSGNTSALKVGHLLKNYTEINCTSLSVNMTLRTVSKQKDVRYKETNQQAKIQLLDNRAQVPFPSAIGKSIIPCLFNIYDPASNLYSTPVWLVAGLSLRRCRFNPRPLHVALTDNIGTGSPTIYTVSPPLVTLHQFSTLISSPITDAIKISN
jgi:hypothetical protein